MIAWSPNSLVLGRKPRVPHPPLAKPPAADAEKVSFRQFRESPTSSHLGPGEAERNFREESGREKTDPASASASAVAAALKTWVSGRGSSTWAAWGPNPTGLLSPEKRRRQPSGLSVCGGVRL